MANETELDLIISNADVVLSSPSDPSNYKMENLDIGIKNGQITSMGTLAQMNSKQHWNAKGLTILPGLIDTQVHFREPGLEHKETIEMGSRSAVAGGITGFFEMPNTNPPTLTEAAFQKKIEIALSTSYCDFAFYMGAAAENVSQLPQLETLRGCSGVKVFMGSSTGTLLVESDAVLEDVLKHTKRRVAVHCEDEARLIERKPVANASQGDPSFHEKWRDENTALLATQRLTKLAIPMKHPIHVLHVTTREEMELLRELKKQNPFITVETTPQHLTLESPDCYLNLGTRAQMNPPIRNSQHRLALWKAIQNKVVDIIGSDHAPHTLEEKAGTYPNTPSGMPGVQTSLPVLLNHVNQGHLSIFDVVRLMSTNPCTIFGIQNKGFLAPGYEGTLSVVDLKKEKTIEDQWIESKSGWTPFHGMKVKGWPEATIIRGEYAMQNGEIHKIKSSAFEFEN